MFKLIIKTLGLVKDFSDAKEWFGKRWFVSKTLWINAIAVLAMWLQNLYGLVITAEEQLYILATINIIVRFFTKQPLVLREEDIVHLKEDKGVE